MVSLEEDIDLLGLAIPSYLKCPLSYDIVQDPVQTCDGQVYDRVGIEAWFARGRRTSPMTNLQLPSLALTPVPVLKRALDEWMLGQAEEVRKALEARSMEQVAQNLEKTLQAQDLYVAKLEESHLQLSPQQKRAWRRLLWIAVSRGDVYVLRLLGDAGALAALHIISTDVDVLRAAVRSGRANMVEVMAELGAPLSGASPEDGATSAHVAAAVGNVEVLESIARYGGSLSARALFDGSTPMTIAVLHGHTAMAAAIARLGADIESVNLGGSPPILHIPLSPHVEFVDIFMQHRVSPNSRCLTNGRTVLHCAAGYGQEEVVDALLHVGACPDILDFQGCTPADTAWNYGHYALSALVGSPSTPRWMVTVNVPEGGILVREGCDLNSGPKQERLASGALVSQIGELRGQRLHFQTIFGKGPSSGWVSIRTKASGALLLRTRMEYVNHIFRQCSQSCLLHLAQEALPAGTPDSMVVATERLRHAAADAVAQLAPSRSATEADLLVQLLQLLGLVDELHDQLALEHKG